MWMGLRITGNSRNACMGTCRSLVNGAHMPNLHICMTLRGPDTRQLLESLPSTGRLASRSLEDHLAKLLKSRGNAKDLVGLKQLHARIRASEHRQSRYLANLLVETYGKCGALEDACSVFRNIKEPNLFSWNIMIGVYVQYGHLEDAKSLFDRMKEWDIVSWNAMIQAYAQGGDPEKAKKMFEMMPEPDAVSWNTMIAAYAQKGHIQEAKEMFHQMPIRDVITWNSIMAAYAQAGHLEGVKSMFDGMPDWNMLSCTTMLRAFAEKGCLEEAKTMFDRMGERDVVAWNTMIQAYAQNGHLEEAERMLHGMVEQSLVTWNTMVAAYAQNGNLEGAKNVFDRMAERNVVSWTAMLAAYAQSGHVEKAKTMFDKMPERNMVTWSAMVAGYAHSGHGKVAIELFQVMELEGVEPSDISFLSLLTACNHVGSVHGSCQYFISMATDHNIPPATEHYACMVDILGRAGRLKNAEELISNMPYQPDPVVWAAFVGACRIHRKVELEVHAAERLVELAPGNPTSYIMLANSYAAAGRQEDVATVRETMKAMGLKKQPGINFLSIESQVRMRKLIAGNRQVEG